MVEQGHSTDKCGGVMQRGVLHCGAVRWFTGWVWDVTV